MKKYLSLFAFFAMIWSFGQKTISGKITNKEGDAVPSASVTIEEPGKDAIIAYGISNSKGEYKVNFNSSASQVEVKIKAFNHKPFQKTINNASQNINFTMESQATEIKEVVIKAKIITSRGDTLNYDLKAFENKADRTLADVLKKMPGVEVNKDGSIIYQGKPISKFYVEGKDLMEGGYGVINNALPKDDVAKVQVLENHQPVKMLQGKVPSEDAAFNIVLKKNVSVTGRGEVGVGMSPFLWNVKMTPMFFSKKAQWVANYKTNNNGEAVENEANLLAFGNRFEGRRSQAVQSGWLSINTAGVPPVDIKRYLLNNVHSFSANVLLNPFKNKEWELKANAVYVNNAVERLSSNKTTTIIDENTQFVRDEFSQNRFYTDKVRGELIFSKNAQKGFFKNVTSWNSFWQRNRGVFNRVLNNTPVLQNESIDSPTFSIENSLSSIVSFGEKMVNFQSYVKYQKDRQTMNWEVNQASKQYAFRQNFQTEALTADHSASLGLSWKNWTITPEVGLNLGFNHLNTDNAVGENGNLMTINPITNGNRLKWSSVNPYTQLGLDYKGEALSLNIRLPWNFYGISAQDDLHQKKNDINRAFLEPSFFANYKFASFFTLRAFGSINYNLTDFGDLYYGNIYTSPNFYANRIVPLQTNRTSSLGSTLEYRNPLNNLFFNLRYRYSENKNNLISNIVRDALGNITQTMEVLETSPRNQSFSAEIGKYIPKAKTNISVNYGHSFRNSYSAAQYLPDPVMLLRESVSTTNTYGFKFNNSYFSWLSVDYLFSYGTTEFLNKTESIRSDIKSMSHNLNTYLYPLESHTVGFFLENSSQDNAGRKFNNTFMDLSYQYTWSKKKIDFELKWMNILNKKSFDQINISGDNRVISVNHYDLRPSQFMFTVKFNFK